MLLDLLEFLTAADFFTRALIIGVVIAVTVLMLSVFGANPWEDHASSEDIAGQAEEIRRIRELLDERTKAVESYIKAKRLGAEMEELPEQLQYDAVKRKFRKGVR